MLEESSGDEAIRKEVSSPEPTVEPSQTLRSLVAVVHTLLANLQQSPSRIVDDGAHLSSPKLIYSVLQSVTQAQDLIHLLVPMLPMPIVEPTLKEMGGERGERVDVRIWYT